ncbi:MAG TPA: glutamate synthase large subunit [Candidatus Binatia bacterium]|nr:glutamate synthase large subunit [Candidatus Binatia bacterium]
MRSPNLAEHETEHDACGVGFLADLSNRASHDVIRLALEAAGSMAHRGARAADGRTGDGAGILCETPRALLQRELVASGLRVPERHAAAVGLFLPRDAEDAAAVRERVELAVREAEVSPIRWRTPQVDESVLGQHARNTAPRFEQLIVDMGPGNVRERMRAVRRGIDRAFREMSADATLVSASSNSVVYKGLLSSNELGAYYKDLADPLFASRFAVFHQRFSTNTSPQWRLVQPFKFIAHNGEINTITGNKAWMHARGIATHRWASDSFDFDTAIGAMIGAGYRVEEAVDLMLAPAVEAEDDRLRAYYDAHMPTVEPWDGPAAIVFNHLDTVGAALDRNGFRPLRWCRTASNKVLCASEAGVVDFGDDPIVKRGRLGPGERLVVRFASAELVEPQTFRAERRERADFRPVVKSWEFDALENGSDAPDFDDAMLLRFGFVKDDYKGVVGVMAAGQGEPVYSMGDDASLAFLERRVPLAHYLRQRFAQVTNPPIDPLREGLVFDMRAFVGSGPSNGDVPATGSVVMVAHAVLDEHTFDSLRFDHRLEQRPIALALGKEALDTRLKQICDDAVNAVREGATFIVLDNRGAGVAIPAVLAVGAVHQRLTKEGLRMQASLAAADGYARDSHSIATVIAAGANVVTPWLALRAAQKEGTQKAFLSAVRSGVLKIMSKLGICSLRSYTGAQTFESIGLGREIVDLCFPGMKAHVPSVTFAQFEEDMRAWAQHADDGEPLPDRGYFRFRREGVRHTFDPNVIKNLRANAMHGDYDAFEKLSDQMQARPPITLRDLIEPVPIGPPVPLEEVEPVSAIVKRFTTAAMSLGALAPEVHKTIAIATNRIGAKSNSGEGGEDPSRYARTPDSGRSAIKQVASARFGVSAQYLASADEIEIKMAQGSKPGEGGQIPGHKVSVEIAKLRGAIPGQGLISPPPHHDIYSIEDLAQLIYDLHRVAPQAKVAVKLVAQSGIGHVASGVAKGQAEVIHISGHDGGTGASPLGSIKHSGLPWELGLVETHHTLVATGLRSRVRLRVDGGFKTGRDVVLAAMLGADNMGFGTALLVALGCIYARQCHLNTCPVGIATQDPELRKKFKGTPEEAIAYLEFVGQDVRRRLAALGARSIEEIHGRSDLLRRRADLSEEYQHVDLSVILRLPERSSIDDVRPGPESHLDDYGTSKKVLTISPSDRAVGARLAHNIVEQRNNGEKVRPSTLRYVGTAGQSFGAFVTDGLTLELRGDANDYVGKSMDGGRIIIRSVGDPSEPAIGNACFYGARGGHAFILGTAGERLAVRNSGVSVVVEGAGDHACEYMTKGIVVILGPTGRNLASGMSGGVAFALGAEHTVRHRLGPTECAAAQVEPNDPNVETLRKLLEAHAQATESPRAIELLADWPQSAKRFVKIAPAQPVEVAPERAAPVLATLPRRPSA